MPTTTLTLADQAATERFAARLAPLLRPGDVVGLRGDLGSGKTALARAIIRARAGAALEVPSPTYTLVQLYLLPGIELWHVDLYRLRSVQDAVELGLDDAFAGAATLIEWPERLGPHLPADRLDLALKITGSESRSLVVEGGPSWQDRLPALADG